MERKNVLFPPQSIISAEETEKQKEIMRKINGINKGFSKKACVITFGCQQNEADSERIEGILQSMGYSVLDAEEKAECDVIDINTCAIREHAELKAFSRAGQLKHIKSGGEKIIAMCGCMTEQEHQTEKIKKSYPYVDIIFGTHAIYKFPEMLYNVINKNKKLNKFEIEQNKITEGFPVYRKDKYRANISIMYGCDNFCSYCVVPYVRGRERSRDKNIILDEIKSLVDEGCKEFMLLGQNVNSYGSDEYRFPELLSDILKISGDYLIRFMTSHPKDASDDLISIIKSDRRVERRFHLPLQSGNNRILGLMNRKYTSEQYLELTEKIKSAIPEVSITSDIIIAFPTETEEEFLDTLNIVKTVKFDNIYPFIYSKRKNTAAEKMECGILKEEKNRRFNILLETQNEISLQSNQACVGKTFRVLTEGASKNSPEYLTGRTSQNKLVHFKGSEILTGQFTDIKITEAKLHTLYGELQ